FFDHSFTARASLTPWVVVAMRDETPCGGRLGWGWWSDCPPDATDKCGTGPHPAGCSGLRFTSAGAAVVRLCRRIAWMSEYLRRKRAVPPARFRERQMNGRFSLGSG